MCVCLNINKLCIWCVIRPKLIYLEIQVLVQERYRQKESNPFFRELFKKMSFKMKLCLDSDVFWVKNFLFLLAFCIYGKMINVPYMRNRCQTCLWGGIKVMDGSEKHLILEGKIFFSEEYNRQPSFHNSLHIFFSLSVSKLKQL